MLVDRLYYWGMVSFFLINSNTYLAAVFEKYSHTQTKVRVDKIISFSTSVRTNFRR